MSKPFAVGKGRVEWWAHPDSNQGPAGYEPAALPLSYGPKSISDFPAAGGIPSEGGTDRKLQIEKCLILR